ncbi:MAG TPA: nucleotidyltransferase family protein [Rhizomicrobium sp.]
MPHAPKKQIAAIVLAAGTSSRMGHNKLLIELYGERLIRHVARAALASEARPLLVVTGNEAHRMEQALSGLDLAIVHNPDFRGGLSTSLRAGVGVLPPTCDGALILLGDMPAITSACLDRLIAAFAPEVGRAICVASHGGKRGNPVLFARRFFPNLLETKGDLGARWIVAQNSDVVTEVEADDDGPLVDIDTPAALAAFLARKP